jgi:hypothetical protein
MRINRTGAMRPRWLFFGATKFFGTMTLLWRDEIMRNGAGRAAAAMGVTLLE